MVSSFCAADSVLSVQMDRTCVWPLDEQAGAVDARQNADLGVERADLVHLAAVDALALEQPLLDDLLLHLVQADLDV